MTHEDRMIKMYGYDIYKLTKENLYFCYSLDDGFAYFKSEKERDEFAALEIQNHLQDGWSEDVEHMRVGKVTGEAVQTNVRPSDSSEFDYFCDYEIKPPV